MNREGHNSVSFFIGSEVEKTPAFSKRTLFVVGKQDVNTILKLAKENNVAHVFMGANHSFNVEDAADKYWDNAITKLLDTGLWVTLDYQAHQHGDVLELLNRGIWQSRLFVPLLSIRIPNFEASNVNLTVKIDDVDFKATNPGVWCMHHTELTDSNRFTDWQEYESDSVIHTGATLVTSLETKVEPTKKVVMGTGTDNPDVNAQIAEKVVETFNNQELGLDVKPTTALKDELVPEQPETTVAEIKTPEAAADAYAEGTKADPLAPEQSKKPKAKK